MNSVRDVLANNTWITQIVSAELRNGSMPEGVKHSDEVADWVLANAEGRFVRVAYSRAYGFELESDIVLFHLTWGKG